MSKNKTRINKARYWTAVLWQEHLEDDWQDTLADTIQLPFAYCVHDKDLDSEGDNRKPHVHIIVAFTNTTTYKHALEVFRLIGGEKAVNTCEAVVNIRSAYDYLIHNTETCRKQGKHLYDASERITGNNFDIGMYEQISLTQKREMLKELRDFIIHEGFTNIVEFTLATLNDAKFCEFAYQDVALSYTSTLDKFCAGNYKNLVAGGSVFLHESCVLLEQNITEKNTEKNTEKSTFLCPDCGSDEIIKKGKTAGGTQRFCCKECGKVFTL